MPCQSIEPFLRLVVQFQKSVDTYEIRFARGKHPLVAAPAGSGAGGRAVGAVGRSGVHAHRKHVKSFGERWSSSGGGHRDPVGASGFIIVPPPFTPRALPVSAVKIKE